MIFYYHILRDVAQLVARLVWDQNVAGSSPVIPMSGLASLQAFFMILAMNYVWELLGGALNTISLTLFSVSTGLVFSFFIALGKISKNKVINSLSSFYIFFFRGTPLLLQLYFLYYELPKIWSALTISSPFIAAYIAFSLNSAAYLAEVVRAAIVSIDKGQYEASYSLGLNKVKTFIHVILPQAIPRLLPPVGNEFILVLKDASIASIVALKDITKVSQNISASTGSRLVYILAIIIYLIFTAFFSWTFRKLEQKSIAYTFGR